MVENIDNHETTIEHYNVAMKYYENFSLFKCIG